MTDCFTYRSFYFAKMFPLAFWCIYCEIIGVNNPLWKSIPKQRNFPVSTYFSLLVDQVIRNYYECFIIHCLKARAISCPHLWQELESVTCVQVRLVAVCAQGIISKKVWRYGFSYFKKEQVCQPKESKDFWRHQPQISLETKI